MSTRSSGFGWYIVSISFLIGALQTNTFASLSNDTCDNAMEISTFPTVITVDTSFADSGVTQPYCGQTMQHDAWYEVPLTVPTRLRIEIDNVEPSNQVFSAVLHTPGASCTQNLFAACAISDASGTPIVWEWFVPTPRTYLLQVGVAGTGNGGPTQIKIFAPRCGDGSVDYPETCDPATASPSYCNSFCMIGGADNLYCEFAQEIGPTLPASTATGLFGPEEGPACDNDPVGKVGWFKVAGTGNTMTATTCAPGTDQDTALNVFCGLCTSMQCIGGNDDQAGAYDNACDPNLNGTNVGSTFSWCSLPDVTYYIAVSRADLALSGVAELVVSDSGVACGGAIDCRPAQCGNGTIDVGEECDDGNLSSGDGCGDFCDEEIANDSCDSATLFATLPFFDSVDTTFADSTPLRATCGTANQFMNRDVWYKWIPDTSCDVADIQVSSSDFSVRASLFEGADCMSQTGLICNQTEIITSVEAGVTYWIVVLDPSLNTTGGTFSISVSCAFCGNGLPEVSEECDDGNTIDNDACTNGCRLPRCGDGILQVSEICDDGNSFWGDSCGGDCSIEAACVTPVHCRYVPENNACNHVTCNSGTCEHSTCVIYGDLNGSGVVNLDDVLCTLRGFGSDPTCSTNGDIFPCGGDGILNLNDILAMLSAFGGADPCGCDANAAAPLCGSNQP